MLDLPLCYICGGHNLMFLPEPARAETCHSLYNYQRSLFMTTAIFIIIGLLMVAAIILPRYFPD